MVILTIFITIILSIDYLISNTADILQSFIISPLGIGLFAICAISSIVTQVIFMYYVKGSWSSLLEKSVFAIQSIINFLLVYILLEIISPQQYNSQILIFITSLSYLISIFLCGYLAVKFFQWLKINKHYVIFFYFIAVTFFCFNGIITLIFSDVLLFQKPTIITPDSPVIFDIGFEEGTIMSYISLTQSISMNIYFVALWLGTIGILRYNIRKIGKVKFWVIITLPIIYFIGYELSLYQFIYPENPVSSSISSNFLYSILLYTFSFIFCGILFGVSFFILKSHVKNDVLGKHLVTTGVGLIIFFISGTATLIQAAYPPYGAPSIAFLGLATYFIFIGLYKSALSISHDYALLKTIENSIIKDSNLLNLIGKSQFEVEAYKKVKSISEKYVNDNATHKLASEMTDEEIKKHINAISQVRKQVG
jgi:hypothetical protein